MIMRNAYYIDDSKKNKTLTILGRICYARTSMQKMQSVLDQEIELNKKLLAKYKEREIC
tara:strand:- start:817 stop:993 length:177 start_codon:yes stop_codon:yes gene_type:complete